MLAPFSMADNSYDFIMYVARWPGTYTTNTEPSDIDDFALHGFWPTNNDNTYPQNCDGAKFSMDAISSIVDQLDYLWPDLQHPGQSPSGFWEHEWSKHGTCCLDGGACGGATDQLGFFSFALKTHTSMDLGSILTSAGIVPSTSTKYPMSQVASAINGAAGASPLLTCGKVDGGHGLLRVYMCLDSASLAPITCPTDVSVKVNTNNGCGSDSTVMLPPINH